MFGVSVAVLLLIVYWITLAAIEQQLKDSVERESRLLVEIHATRGLESLLRGVQRRISDLRSPRRVLLLQDASGKLLAGNLPVMDARRWDGPRSRSPLRPSIRHLGATTRLPVAPSSRWGAGSREGSSCWSERTCTARKRRRKRSPWRSAWGIVTTVLLALGGGALITTGFLKRIEDVNRTAAPSWTAIFPTACPTRGSGDEMDQLAVNLNAMLDRIQALMESLKRVSDDIAHDLRTPLSRLRQKLEVARASVSTPEGYTAVMDQSIAEVDAILETFQALLRIAQIEAGTRRAAFSEVELGRRPVRRRRGVRAGGGGQRPRAAGFGRARARPSRAIAGS